MSDVEKGFETRPNMPPPSYNPQSRDRTSEFQGPYEHFVNDNLRAMTGIAGRPPQNFDIDLPKRDSRFPSKQRLWIYFVVGVLIALAISLVGYFVLGGQGKDGKDGKDAKAEEVRTVTKTTTPTTSSSSSVSLSVSVSVSNSISTTTTLSRTTKRATTTLVTTASTPKSILDAASSYYEALSEASVAATRNPGTMAEPPSLLPSSATTTIMETAEPQTLLGAVTMTTTPIATPTTLVPELTPPPPETTKKDEDEPARTVPNFINFCGVPGQACG